MKRCDRFGAFFAAELFLQAAIIAGTFFVGSFSASFAQAGIVRTQTESEAVALGDSSTIKIVGDWTETVTLSMESDPCERTYDGEPIADDDSALEANQPSRETVPSADETAADDTATYDTATNECGDYLSYRYGHLESFFGEGNFAAGDEKIASDDTADDEENIAAEETKASADDAVATGDNVADDENTIADKGGEEEETVADIAKMTEAAKADDVKAAQMDECYRYKYIYSRGRCDVNEDQVSNNETDKSTDDKVTADDADDTPAAEDYSAAKTEGAYGRDYQGDGEEDQVKATNDSKDDANDSADDNDLNSIGCLAVCDALLAVVNDAAGQASSELRIYYSVVTQLSLHGTSAK